jgi:iron-regulated transporter 1
MAAGGLILGVIFSRIGLWGFDLFVQIIIQDEVEPGYRGSFSATEASVQNTFELGSYAMTAIFARPAEFRYLAVVSAVAVLLAAGLFAGFVRKRRGHLVHTPACFGMMEVKRRAEGYQRLAS